MNLSRSIPAKTWTVVCLTALLASFFSGCSSGPASSGEHGEESAVVHTGTPADLDRVRSTKPIVEREVVLYVNGLGCPLCARNIDLQLTRAPGVTDVRTDLSLGTITLSLDGKSKPTPAKFEHAVEDAGFTLVKIETR